LIGQFIWGGFLAKGFFHPHVYGFTLTDSFLTNYDHVVEILQACHLITEHCFTCSTLPPECPNSEERSKVSGCFNLLAINEFIKNQTEKVLDFYRRITEPSY
jgi:hypothetical protein